MKCPKCGEKMVLCKVNWIDKIRYWGCRQCLEYFKPETTK